MSETLERLKAELKEWRASFDHLRVQANLGRKDARDKLRELGDRLDPAWQRAKGTLDEVVKSGTTEARTLGKSLLAGWEEVRRTHRTLAREAKLERDEDR
jgi:hypothetical protein